MATQMARRQVRLKRESQFIVFSEMLDLRFPVLLHPNGLDHTITKALNRQGTAYSGGSARGQIQNRVNPPSHSDDASDFMSAANAGSASMASNKNLNSSSGVAAHPCSRR